MNIKTCKHCKMEFDVSDKPKGWMANHSRWCNSNPKRDDYSKNLNKVRAAKKNFNNQYSYGASCSEETREKLRKAATGKRHTEETKNLIRQKALESPHRRLVRNIIEYNGVKLESSWELSLAKRLDNLGIRWIRPDPIPWVDKDNIRHNYFPDFYLVDYDIYLDPKNPQAVKVQKEKLDILMKTYDNIIILYSLKECDIFNI